MSVPVLLVAVFFAAMGLAALANPAFVWAPFGVAPVTPASRNEVRAVYGGFGLAVAGLLVAAERASEGFREGALVAIALALAGMAAGRLIGLVVEPASLRGYPALFLAVEVALAGALVTGL